MQSYEKTKHIPRRQLVQEVARQREESRISFAKFMDEQRAKAS